MFDVGWPELLVIAIVLIVVVGPKDLPRMLRTFGRTTAKMRSMAADFRKQFDEALKEAELEDVKSLTDQARSLDPRQEIRKHLSPLEKAGQDIRSGLDAAMKPKPSETRQPASGEAKAAEPAKTGAVETPAVAADGAAAVREGKKPADAAKKAPAGNGGGKNGAGRKKKPASSARTKSASAAAPKKTAGNGAKKPATNARKKAEKPASRPKSSAPAKSSARGKASGTVS